MEISGLRYQPERADIRGLVLHTDVDQCNSFECSSELLNAIQKMTTRTFLCNLFSVQSDCPARERFGYGGDLNAVSEAYIYNFDMRSFYRKTIYDWMDAVKDSGFVDTAPFIGLEYCGISWESALLITQYNLYLYYNDIELVRDLYPFDLAWMEKVKRLHGSSLVEKGLSDHEALIPSTVQLTGTVHYLQCSRIMARFARLLHDSANEGKFQTLSDSLSHALRVRFCEQPVDPSLNRQTLFASLLYSDIIPPVDVAAVVDSLTAAINLGPAGHFTTGIFGTKYILEAASRHGLAETVFNIVNSRQFPGWGFMVDRGATTIWETWKESDDIYSNCHPMFGSVSEWFYRWLAGIQPDPDFPGFEQFTLAPVVPKELAYVKCSYRSPYGTIQSNWRKEKNGIVYSLVVPNGCKAHFYSPAGKNAAIQIAGGGTGGVEKIINQEPVFRKELSQGSFTITIVPAVAGK
jgi:alpha-L-rhamnosidase